MTFRRKKVEECFANIGNRNDRCAHGRGIFNKAKLGSAFHYKIAVAASKPSPIPLGDTMDMKTSRLALLKEPSLPKTGALINGQWVKGSTRFDIHDPATGAKFADVASKTRTTAWKSSSR
jgi:hypothetical protein